MNKYSSYNKFFKCIPGKYPGIHYIIVVLALTILFSANLAIGAEGINASLKKTPAIAGTTGGASKVAKTSKLKKTVEKESAFTNKQGLQSIEKEQSPFMKSLFKMFQALFAVLAVIGGIAGAVLFYKWFKNKTAFVEQLAVQHPIKPQSPETVSEAVASFVKHRIKK